MEIYLTFDDIKKRYPNEWVLLGNPKTTDLEVLGGIVLFHSTNKKEVFVAGKEKIKPYALSTLVYAGDLKHIRKLGIFRKLASEKPSDFAGIWKKRPKVDAQKLRKKAWQ